MGDAEMGYSGAQEKKTAETRGRIWFRKGTIDYLATYTDFTNVRAKGWPFFIFPVISTVTL
jgi:hypothetical protein